MRRLLTLLLAGALALPVPAWSRCGDGVLDPNEACDDYNWFGGDGCAQNCTPETLRRLVMDPEQSRATTQLDTLTFRLNLNGSLGFTAGAAGADGIIPFVIRDEHVQFDPIQVPPIGCVCVDSQEVPELFGPGNVAMGSFGCGGDDFFIRDYLLTQDHNVGIVGTCLGGNDNGKPCADDPNCDSGDCFTESDCWLIGGFVEPPEGIHAGVCNGPPEISVTAGGPRGSAAIVDNVSFTFLFDGGSCCVAGVDPDCPDPEGLKGPDGAPCTADDLTVTPGTNLPAVTGLAQAAAFDFNNQLGKVVDAAATCGDAPCITEVSGELFDCDAILADPNGGLDTGVFALAFPILDNADFGDSIATIRFAAKRQVTCRGDCNGDDKVTVDELVTAVAIALGTKSVDECTAADGDSSGMVEIHELVTAVNHALSGCE